MSTTTASSLQIGTLRNCKFSCPRGFKGVVTPTLGGNLKAMSWAKLRIVYNVSSLKYFQLNSTTSSSTKFGKISTQAMSGSSENTPVSGLPVDLKGNRAFIAGVAVDNGYGWAIAKSLAAAGAEIIVGTWVPALNIFESSLRRGKFDKSRALPDGSLMEITKIYPLDAVFDNPEDVPEVLGLTLPIVFLIIPRDHKHVLISVHADKNK